MSDDDPPLSWPGYRSTATRAPLAGAVRIDPGRIELSDPVQASDPTTAPVGADDLTAKGTGQPIGERIIVTGRVLDGDGTPVPHALVGVWQANAAGRYAHALDDHAAPLDPAFAGAGACHTGPDGCYRFVTVRPGAYPWRNHPNAWRPAHIHFSVFGRRLTQRLVTQMYFPGDPLLDLDPIFGSVPEPARPRLVAAFDLDTTEPEWALGYRWDIVLRGSAATPAEREAQP